MSNETLAGARTLDRSDVDERRQYVRRLFGRDPQTGEPVEEYDLLKNIYGNGGADHE